VTPIANAYIFIDRDGDGNFEEKLWTNALQSRRITDATDEDMTGAVIVAFTEDDNGKPGGTPVQMAAAWGQDPLRASYLGESDSLDLGTLIVPLANPFIDKEVIQVTDSDGNIKPRNVVDKAGDKVYYRITVANVGFGDLTNVAVSDSLIPSLVGPVESFQPLDGILSPGETFTYTGTYIVPNSVIDSLVDNQGSIVNVATVTTDGFPPVSDTVTVPVQVGTISGTVLEDIDNDDTGDNPLTAVTINLFDNNGNVIATTTTDGNGNYLFEKVPLGVYIVQEEDPSTFISVNDSDGGDPNQIEVTLVDTSLVSSGNNFVDEQPGTISGTVLEDIDNDDIGDNPLAAVTIKLLDDSDSVVATTITNASGDYIFEDVAPGLYKIVEVDPFGFISVTDTDGVNDNTITITLNPSENSTGNDFVDEQPGGIVNHNGGGGGDPHFKRVSDSVPPYIVNVCVLV
jgi:hypothetical protein